jgi:ligand-binding sensor domain-containing protein/signal transduction histidine kinase/DNA-binding response OmpR family regulator
MKLLRPFALVVLLLSALRGPLAAQDDVHYYFNTLDIRNGLSQNTVNAIMQDRMGFMWFGTKDGLNRYDGISFRVFKREECELGNNFITVLHEDNRGHIWIGTDAGVYIYDPATEHFTHFDLPSDVGQPISRAVTSIESDERGDIWISSDDEGLFHYDRTRGTLRCHFQKEISANVTRFWFDNNRCWIGLWSNNLYHTDRTLRTPLTPFRDADGREVFKGDIINAQVKGLHNCIYIGSMNGLTEVNLTTLKTRRLLHAYVRALQFKTDDELWAGTESGLYICNLKTGKTTHLTVPGQDDAYTLSDNAIYSLCLDREDGIWIGSYFGGVNYYPHQWTYFEKYYPHADMSSLGRRVREFCPAGDGTLWIGTEDRGLFHFDPSRGTISPFTHPAIGDNVHGLCLDGNDLWVGTFAGGLNRIDLRTHRVTHYDKGEGATTLNSNDVFVIRKTTASQLWIGTTSGLMRYNRDTDDFTRIPALTGVFVYDMLEDVDGNLWLATYSNGVYRYDIGLHTWHNYVTIPGDTTSLPYNKVVSIFQDSRKRLWFTTQGGGFCRFLPETETFRRYDAANGFPGNSVFKLVEDERQNLWITTANGLVRFHPDSGEKRLYTTANGLLTNQFNYQSAYRDPATGRIYLGGINGFIAFYPRTFVENTYIPPVVITDFFLFNKRLPVADATSPLRKSIILSDAIELSASQNSFTLHAAALSYQSPGMNRLLARLDGYDADWQPVGSNGLIAYANLPYGHYTFRLKGSNSDGVWNPTERTLSIRIHPPFYLSGWAYLFYLVLLSGGIIGLLAYYKRRTVRRRREVMQQMEHDKEREIYTAKIDFFTNVAHEIRTPLTLIKSPLENVLATPDLPADVRDDLEIMDLNTNRLLDLVNQLLDFRKTESKGFRLALAPCDVTRLVGDTYTRFVPFARRRKLDFTLDCQADVHASADSEGITKIVSNLFTNAVKYADTYIRAHLRADADTLQLTVCNDGTVVPVAMRDEIFKPFTQYRGGVLQSVPGSGIGLALARSLAELHGGTLVMDEPAGNNSFTLTLPLRPPHAADEADTSAADEADAAQEAAEPQASPSGYTLLVVEDNAEMRAFIVKQLSPSYTLLTAADGVEALRVLEDNIVHLILTDIMMPHMDGLELCERVKSQLDYSHIPVILLTAKTTLQARIEGMKIGADVYIEKPFSVEYLRVCIGNLLTGREKLRASFVRSPFVQTSTLAITKADEHFLKQLNAVISDNMQDPEFSLDHLTRLLGMSRSNLNRKIRGLLDMTPNDYIRLERLRRAAQLLKAGESRINEVCYMVGFNTPSYFTKCFQKQFGKLPKDFLKA